MGPDGGSRSDSGSIYEDVDYQVLLYYMFVPLDDPEAIAREQRSWCTELGLHGRIIVASEGINGTLSGLKAATDEYRARMSKHPSFRATEFKVDEHDGHAFKKLSIKVRDEIVTLGVQADAIGNTGTHLSPREFQAKLNDPQALVLDIRNDYEYDMGRFRGAVRPDVQSFKEFPQWLRDNFSNDKKRPILTYCTGGIRCEKLTAFLKDEGFEDVYQLHGGIVTYAKDPVVQGEGFDGDCFMFDDRLSVPVGKPVSRCEECGEPCARYVNCSNVDCNRLYFLCQECEDHRGVACSESCRDNDRQRERNEKLVPTLRRQGKRLRRQRHRAKVRERAKALASPDTQKDPSA